MHHVRNLALAGLVAASLAACGSGSTGAGPAVTEEDFVMGKADAPVTVVEYASVACGACATFNNETFPEFKAKYVDTGQVRYVAREFLTGEPALAVYGFLLARCAGRDRYFAVTDAIYRAQSSIYQSGDIRGGLLAVAKSAGMTEEDFQQCVNDKKAVDDLNARVQGYAKDPGVTHTPTFYVNGKVVESGGQLTTLEQLDAAIAEAKAE